MRGLLKELHATISGMRTSVDKVKVEGVINWNPAPLLKTLNKCLEEKVFPTAWKWARILLLHKGRSKPVDEPGSFRPISLLDGAGKLLERIIKN